jgi:hypothetical protein
MAFLIPLWEKVARNAGSVAAERDPSPGFAFRGATLSHKGKG